jgi:hypothetical protein
MTQNSTFDLHIETLKRDCANIFDSKSYDAILYAAKILFGERNVTYTERSILIKDKVCIELSLSWNEQKAYIYTYFDTDMLKGERLKDADNINYELRKINPYFRLFGLNEIIQYLQMKEIENRFITNNEG